MRYINERPIVSDDDDSVVLQTSINPQVFDTRKHTKYKKTNRELKSLHRALSRGKPNVKLKDAERILRRRIGRNKSGLKSPRGEGGFGEREDVLHVEDDVKHNQLDQGIDNNEKPLDPRNPSDPIMQAFRKKQKARLQRATHGSAPPIFPDPTVPMNPDLYEIRKSPEGPDKDKPVFKLPQFQKEKENVSQGKCATCGGGRGEFKDALSEKEYKISGLCQNCQDKMFGEAVEKEEMFPKLYDIPKLTKGLSKAQLTVWNKAMNKPSSARKAWRPPSTATKLAKRLADSVLYEDDEKSSQLVKRPAIGGRSVAHLRTLKKSGGLTGSDAYRPRSAHATLTRTQPHRFIEKMSSLVAAWRSTKTGQGRQVVKNLAVAPRRGREARRKFLKAQSSKHQEPKK